MVVIEAAVKTGRRVVAVKPVFEITGVAVRETERHRGNDVKNL